MFRLHDIHSVPLVNISGCKTEDGHYKKFRIGTLMDRVSRKAGKTTLLATFDATNSGTIVNRRVYPGIFVRRSIASWTEPYAKPVYDRHTSPNPDAPEPKTYGRARAAEFIQLVDEEHLKNDWAAPRHRDRGSGFVKIQTAIHDPQAIEELLDEPAPTRRFLTVSAAMDTPHMWCSVCGKDWKDGRCEHDPGGVYTIEDEDRQAEMFHITGLLYYDHLAKVGTPAQPYATVMETEMLDAKTVGLFGNGELVNSTMSGLLLIDSRDGVTELMFDRQEEKDLTAEWTMENWADACVLAALADQARLDDMVLDEAGPQIEAFRASERNPYSSVPKMRVGPGGLIPIHDANTASSALRLLDKAKRVDAESVRSSILDCMDHFENGRYVMPKDPAQEWADVVKLADSLEIEDGKCPDFSDAEIDYFDLAFEDGAAEIEGVEKGRIPADAKLTTKKRKALPDSVFCGPNRSFPVHDAAHVRNALARLPQSHYGSSTKAKILACIKRAAKKHGVDVSEDSLRYADLVSLDDGGQAKAPPDPKPPEGETAEQAVKRLESANKAAKAKIKDQETQIGRLLEDQKNVHGELRRILAGQLFSLRVHLEKTDVKGLKDEAARQEYMARLADRSLDSLRDSIADLEAESSENVEDPTPPSEREQDPTDPKDDNGEPKVGEAKDSQARGRLQSLRDRSRK